MYAAAFTLGTGLHLAWRLMLGLLLVASIGSVSPAHAQTANETQAKLEAFGNYLDSVEQQLASADYREDDLKAWIDKITSDRIAVNDCVSAAEKSILRLKADQSSLGEVVAGEAPDVVRKRKTVEKDIADQERHLSECRVLLLRADELTEQARSISKDVLAQRLFAQGPSLLVLFLDNWAIAPDVGIASLEFIQEHAGLENLSTGQWVWFLVLVLVAFFLGLAVRTRGRRGASPAAPDSTATADGSGGYGASLLDAFLHYAPRLFATTTAALYVYALTHEIRPVPFINVMLYGMPAYLLAFVLIRFLLNPNRRYIKALPISDEFGRRMARRLRILALLGYIGYLLFSTLLAQHIPDETYLLVRGIFAALLFINIAWALWLVARLREQDEFRWVGYLIALVLIVSLGAEWAGYRNLALSVVRVIGGSLVAFATTILLVRVFTEIYDALEKSEGTWSSRLRRLIGVADGQHVPGLTGIRLASYLMLWIMFGYAMLRIWHVPASTVQQIETTLSDGFQLGEFQLVPLRLLLAIALFALLVTAARWAQTRLERHWLRYARIDHGAREAIVTITGYVLIVISALIGLSIAGFEFRNLAIIAGALSVGIGFGLQNIVNNFVSGLILLFERPVKTGDWIVVGSTEGYVKRIRIRSTQIQTFDRADVIVPNSELISQQVTNWMLYDTQGRARVPVGVAYGSDTQKVKAVLEKLAQDHPSVITDDSYPQPKVLFLGFGDSSLNFELRCFIRNIDNRLQVVSDLNFAIDAAFRAEGIEIPFPQRDLHLRSMPPGYRPADGDG